MANPDENKKSEKIIDFIHHSLGISHESSIVTLEERISDEYPIHADIIIKYNSINYIIELKKRLSLQAFSQVALLQILLKNELSNNRNVFVIAASVITSEYQSLAEKMGIQLIQLPYNLLVHQKNFTPSSKGKITADKSWRVVTRLLKEKAISIRQISVKEGISYGLSHKVIQELLDSHIASKDGYLIRIADISPLLNIIAWERNLKKLKIDEFWLPHENVHPAAQELSYVSEEQGINLVFNSFTAAGLYTGYAVKHDELHFYLEKEQLDSFKNQYEETSGFIRAVVYRPDRDVMRNSNTIEGVRVTSPGQTLLDIAGMGYSGITLAKSMVEIFDKL